MFEDKLESITTTLSEDTAKLDGSDVADESMTDELIEYWIVDAANVESTLAKVVSRSVWLERAAEEATADSSSEAELKEIILATTTGDSVGMPTGLKVTADEDIPPALIEVSTSAMTEDRVGVLRSGSAEI